MLLRRGALWLCVNVSEKKCNLTSAARFEHKLMSGRSAEDVVWTRDGYTDSRKKYSKCHCLNYLNYFVV